MTIAILQPGFYVPFIWGVGGLFASILVKYYNPLDDTVGGTLGQAFKSHSRTVLLSFLCFLFVCIAAYENDALTKFGAVTAGWMNQELVTVLMENAKSKLVQKTGGGS